MDERIKSNIRRFLERESFELPLSRVAAIAGTSIKDLTNWRNRGLLPFPPKKIGSRYFVNCNGFLTIGIMAELSWLIGPDDASAAAKAIWETFFANNPHEIDIEEFRDTVVYFRKPIGSLEGGSGKPRFPSDEESEIQRAFGFRLSIAHARELNKQPIPNSTTVIHPIGQLLYRWAIRIEGEFEREARNAPR